MEEYVDHSRIEERDFCEVFIRDLTKEWVMNDTDDFLPTYTRLGNLPLLRLAIPC
jgi:hypothetical protein